MCIIFNDLTFEIYQKTSIGLAGKLQYILKERAFLYLARNGPFLCFCPSVSYTIAHEQFGDNSIAMKFLVTSVVVLCWIAMSQSQSDRTASITCSNKSIDGFCSGVNYTSFATPNFRNGTEESEIDTELQTYAILYSSGCSNALVHFLCAYYKPPCFSTNAGAIRLIPCRELCLYVRSSCEPVLKEFRATATWPDHLDCDQFPLGGDENGSICFPGFHALEDYQTKLILPRISGAAFPSEVVAADRFWSPGTNTHWHTNTHACTHTGSHTM